MMSDNAPQCILSIHAVPGAKASSIAGMYGEAIRIRIQAPPVDGKANKVLLEFLASELGLKTRDLTLIKGDASREKRIEIRGLSHGDALRRLGIQQV